MSNLVTIVVGLKAVGLVLGALITFYAAQAYNRTGSPALRALAIGFGLVTVGAISAGAIDLWVDVDRNQALAVESLFTLMGFGVILYSLYVE